MKKKIANEKRKVVCSWMRLLLLQFFAIWKESEAANKCPAYSVRQFFFLFLFYYYFTDEFHVCIYVFDFVFQFKFVLRSYAEKYSPVKKRSCSNNNNKNWEIKIKKSQILQQAACFSRKRMCAFHESECRIYMCLLAQPSNMESAYIIFFYSTFLYPCYLSVCFLLCSI